MRSEDGSDDHRWLMSNLVWYAVVLQCLMIHLRASKAFFQGFSLICLPPVVCLRGLFIECAWDYWQVETLAPRCCDWLLSVARWNSKQANSLTGGFSNQKPPNCVDWRRRGSSLRPIKEEPSCDAADPYIKMQLALTSTSDQQISQSHYLLINISSYKHDRRNEKVWGDNLKFQPEL